MTVTEHERCSPWLLTLLIFIIVIVSASSAPSLPIPPSPSKLRSHDGNTHPALQSADFASIPQSVPGSKSRSGPGSRSGSGPESRSRSGSMSGSGLESGSGSGSEPPAPSPTVDYPSVSTPEEEVPFEPGLVIDEADPQPSSSSNEDDEGEEFNRPKRTAINSRLRPPQPPPPQPSASGAFENLVSNLKTQLKESHAAQVHTRSIINVLQEKVEAQEHDLSIMKNEISHMKREQAAQREILHSLRSSTSDNSWAIANVKRSHDQTADDLKSLKRLQEHHNETLLVMEEVIMSNALELQGHSKYVGAIRQDLFQLRAQITEDRDKLNKLQRNVQVIQNRQKVRGAEDTDVNIIEENDTDLTNHLSSNRLSPYAVQPPAPQTSPLHSQKLQPGTTGTVTVPSLRPRADSKVALETVKELLGNLSDHVSSVESQVVVLSQRQMLDTQLLHLQQSFMNFTNQIYQLQQWRASRIEKEKENNGWRDDEYKTQYDNDMASLVFHLESHSERIRLLEDFALDYRASDQQTLQNISQSLAQVNTSMSRVIHEISQPKITEEQRMMEGRMRVAEEGLRQNSDRVKDVELMVLNVSLSQCKTIQEHLADEARSGSYVKQVADIQMKMSEQTTAIARLDRGLTGLFQELDKNVGTSSSLAEQLTDLKKLSPEVTSIRRELLNFVLQLPTDCYDVRLTNGNGFHDGVYLIRPVLGRHSARTFCLLEDDTVWTIIQRRTDGRESFARSWDEYRSGFGDAAGEFWLGNENIHRLTDTNHFYRLRIDMWDVLGRYWLAEYSTFRIHPEDALYRLEIGEFRGNATDALRYSNLMPFSALDRDNDVSTTHCAQFYQSGWWYKHCHYSNLNGRYTAGMVWFHQELDEWIQMRQTTMRVAMVTGSDG